MTAIHACDLPPGVLLARYARDGGYTDCYRADIGQAVSHAAYVEAFYTTAVFKVERGILSLAVSRPSTDAQARELAAGTRDTFAAWTVEARGDGQILLCDFQGRTRSWLMRAPIDGGTRLYFGSAVVPVASARGGPPRMGVVFTALLGFHKLYSRVLLRAALSRLARGAPNP